VREGHHRPRRAPAPLHVGTHVVAGDPGPTKWVELCPLRHATAPAICRQLTERIFYRHGCPREIVSDSGRQFIARQNHQLLESFGIRHRTASTYAPHCNSVERTNKTIKTMIAQYAYKDGTTATGTSRLRRYSSHVTPPGTRQPVIRRPTSITAESSAVPTPTSPVTPQSPRRPKLTTAT